MKRNQGSVKVGDRVIYNGFPHYRCFARVVKVLDGNKLALAGVTDRNAAFFMDNTDQWELDSPAKN